MRRVAAVALVALVGTAGCELTEVAIVDVEDVVVAEVYVQIGSRQDLGQNRVLAFLHRTLSNGTDGQVPGASVAFQRQNGTVYELGETDVATCASTLPLEGTGSCYWLPPSSASQLTPGDRLDLTVTLADGSVLTSTATIPGDFELYGIAAGGQCVLERDTPLDLAWSRSAGAWAYVNETEITGIRAALAPRGIDVEDDPLELLGLSVSASDTTIVFPGEFGVFNRFELDQDVALVLQKGLPAGTRAAVTITSADRNYVNWVRGGNFNPSGQVRVPSVIGEGTGVFAATVTRFFEVLVDPRPEGGDYEAPACPVS